MLKNENIICISSIDWDFIWQGHQEIMSVLAKSGNKVIFIENTGVRAPGIRDVPRIKNRIRNWFKGVKGIFFSIDSIPTKAVRQPLSAANRNISGLLIILLSNWPNHWIPSGFMA